MHGNGGECGDGEEEADHVEDKDGGVDHTTSGRKRMNHNTKMRAMK